MSDVQKRVVFCLGEQELVPEAVNHALVDSRIQVHYFGSPRECARKLVKEKCDLLIVDLSDHNTEGLDLIAELKDMPRIGLIDHGDIPTTVRAIKAGAADCIEKPVNGKKLCSEIQMLLGQTEIRSGLSEVALTCREKTVLHHILAGKTSAQIGDILYRSPRTIEVHRKNLMRKLGASNAVELIREARFRGLF